MTQIINKPDYTQQICYYLHTSNQKVETEICLNKRLYTIRKTKKHIKRNGERMFSVSI